MAQNETLTGAMVNSPNTRMASIEEILRALNSVSERYIVTRLDGSLGASHYGMNGVKASVQQGVQETVQHDTTRKVSWEEADHED